MAQEYKNFMKQTMQICINTISETKALKYTVFLKQIGHRLFTFYKYCLLYSTEWLLKLLLYTTKITSLSACTFSKI